MDDSKAALVKQAIEGSEDSFCELLRKVAPRAYRAAVAVLGDSHEAEDIVQESSLEAFRSINNVRNGQAFDSWFLRIVVNRAIDWIRQRQRERDRFAKLTGDMRLRSITRRVEPEVGMDLEKAIEQLPVIHRVVLRMYYVGGHNTREIAELMDRPVGTIRRLLSESYKKLRPLMGSPR